MLALSLALAACGGSGDVTLTVGYGSSPEQVVLGNIYRQALARAGYTMSADVNLGTEPGNGPGALKHGTITGYPEHLSTALTSFFGVALEDVPADADRAYAQAKADFEREGLTAFPPTPFSSTNAVGLLRKTAEERGLKKVSDLNGQSEEMTIAGVAGCHERIDCVEGLERRYGLAFRGFVYKSATETEPFEALEDGWADAAMLPDTDGRLAGEGSRFVILAEDRHVFPAGNAIFVTTSKVAEEAGPEYEKTIVAVQSGLTLPVMQRLDAQVEIEKKNPAAVAAGYLRSIDFSP